MSIIKLNYDDYKDKSKNIILEDGSKCIIKINHNVKGNIESNWDKLKDNIFVKRGSILEVDGWMESIETWKHVIKNTDFSFNQNSNQGQIFIKRLDQSYYMLPIYRINPTIDVSNVRLNHLFQSHAILNDVVNSRIVLNKDASCIDISFQYDLLLSSESSYGEISGNYNSYIVTIDKNKYMINESKIKDISWNRVTDISSEIGIQTRELFRCLGVNNIIETSHNILNNNLIDNNIFEISGGKIKKYIGNNGINAYKRLLKYNGYSNRQVNDIKYIPLKDNIFFYENIRYNDNVKLMDKNVIYPIMPYSILSRFEDTSLNNVKSDMSFELTNVLMGVLEDLSYNVNKSSINIIDDTDVTVVPNQMWGSLGDPYIIGYKSNTVWKMPNFEGFCRMFQGSINKKDFIINAELRKSTIIEQREIESYIYNSLKSINIDAKDISLKYNINCKDEVFMRKLWILYDNKELIVDLNTLKVNNKSFHIKNSEIQTAFPKYSCHNSKNIDIQIIDGLNVIVSSYINHQIKSGFRIINDVEIENPMGAICNKLYQKDMEIKSLTDINKITHNVDRPYLKTINEKYWTSDGKEFENIIYSS